MLKHKSNVKIPIELYHIHFLARRHIGIFGDYAIIEQNVWRVVAFCWKHTSSKSIFLSRKISYVVALAFPIAFALQLQRPHLLLYTLTPFRNITCVLFKPIMATSNQYVVKECGPNLKLYFRNFKMDDLI